MTGRPVTCDTTRMDKVSEGAGLLKHYVARVQKVDDARRVVLGLVYEPDVLDTYGEFMLVEDVEAMAYRFLQIQGSDVIDTNHDNVPNGCYPVESFVARAGDPDFPEGAWVLGVKVPDDHMWRQVKSNEINGFSFEALVRPVPVRASVRTTRDLVGETESCPAAKSDDGHNHVYFVQVDRKGLVTRGWTSEAEDGHSHKIKKASFTEPAGPDRHTHRFFV